MIDFFQTLNIKRFVFGDCENISKPEVFIDFLTKQEYLDLNSQIICFIGANPNQNNWYNTAVKCIQSFDKKISFNISPIRISTEGKNALDMVLSSYVGLAMGQNSRAEFIIVSKDKDYKSVVEHFSTLGISIKRETVENKEQEPINEILKRIREMGEKNKEKLPKTKKRFKNMLLSSFKEYVNEENLDKLSEEVIKELEKLKAISLAENRTKIEWQ